MYNRNQFIKSSRQKEHLEKLLNDEEEIDDVKTFLKNIRLPPAEKRCSYYAALNSAT